MITFVFNCFQQFQLFAVALFLLFFLGPKRKTNFKSEAGDKVASNGKRLLSTAGNNWPLS